MYKSIVVGTDGSETAQRAVTEAGQLANALGGVLHLVSAYQPIRGPRVVGGEGSPEKWEVHADTMVQSLLDEAAAAVRVTGVEADTHMVPGDPADALLKVAAQEKADLIVVGNRGMHGMTRVLGSVPNKVSHRANCSVLIVSTDAPA